MIKASKGNLEVMGTQSQVMAELSTIVSALNEQDEIGTIIAVALGLGIEKKDIRKIIGELRDED